MLSSFCRAKSSDKVVDLGTGTGILPLLIWAKFKPRHIVGIELDEATADMAARSMLPTILKKA
ncbi:MAG: 50S ribosomal protein L11 methyltransferase [Bacillus subtilis]|nr:50S ribosomal protein L11 methyltransferase [Bacillus subtilis]